MRSDFLHYDIFPISRIHPKSIHPKYTYELLLSVGFELRRITRVRIRYSFLAATRGCKVPTRIRVTQTSAGFSGAGALPACERMNRRRTGVYPLIVNMQGGGGSASARVYIYEGDAERRRVFVFVRMSAKDIHGVLAEAMSRENIFRPSI